MRSGPETPYLLKTSIFSERVLWGSLKSNEGSLVTILVIWVSVNPWFLNSSITELGFSGFLRLIFLETERADSGDNPHEFMR